MMRAKYTGLKGNCPHDQFVFLLPLVFDLKVSEQYIPKKIDLFGENTVPREHTNTHTDKRVHSLYTQLLQIKASPK